MDKTMIENMVRTILEPVLSGGPHAGGRHTDGSPLAGPGAWALGAIDPRLPVPVAISNRHVHLSADHVGVLFGKGYELKVLKELSQPGQFACKETVTLVGLSGVIEKVRVLGPSRSTTQIEISRTDGFKLGFNPPVRDSGDIAGSSGATLVGPVGSITIAEGVIIARRHIHMRPEDAIRFKVRDRDVVSVSAGGERGVVFKEVLVRVSDAFSLEMHLDVDEGNSVGIRNGDSAYIG